MWCHTCPSRAGNGLEWEGGIQLQVKTGSLESLEPEGHSSQLAVGNGLLLLADPAPRKLPRVTAQPSAGGVIELEVRFS